MKSGSWITAAAVLAAIALGTTPAAAGVVGKPGEFSVAAPPEKAPQGALRTHDGGETTLAAIAAAAGGPVLVNFWATWCAPCRTEMPSLAALDAASAAAGTGPRVVTVSIDTKPVAEVTATLAEFGGAGLPLYIDLAGDLAFVFGAAGLPFSVLLDADGEIRGAFLGVTDWTGTQATDWFTRALADAP